MLMEWKRENSIHKCFFLTFRNHFLKKKSVESEGGKRRSFFIVLCNALHKEGKPSAFALPITQGKNNNQENYATNVYCGLPLCTRQSNKCRLLPHLKLFRDYSVPHQRLFHSVPLQINQLFMLRSDPMVAGMYYDHSIFLKSQG